ncbi:MAG TPA: adenosine kinase [Stellaceae bacterium]|nr:adenosine kinase [Stellaceae bacterium]
MAASRFDVVGIGNAMVDVLAQADDAFLHRQHLVKGSMTLVDAARAEAIYAEMGPGIEMSGGSAGNTLAGLASLGGRGAYIGKVSDDELGRVFAHDMRAQGVRFDTTPLTKGAATARCLVLVTPDGQRTMSTFLGACVELGPEDVEASLIGEAEVTYLEGYLFDPPRAKLAFAKAAELAHARGRKVALSLSDPFCVARYRAEFRDLLARHVDILFANEAEICELFETKDFHTAARAVEGHCEIAALTRGAKGSVVMSKGATHTIAPAPIARLIDTTGAGDLYASGFLYGFTQGKPLDQCGWLGSLCASEVISHFGARPETPLKTLLAGLASPR